MRHRRPLPAIGEVPIQGVSGWGGRPARNGILPSDGLLRWRVWNTFAWPGAEGVAIADALRGDGDLANDISAAVAALYGWDEEAGAWLAFFPALGDVPGEGWITHDGDGPLAMTLYTSPRSGAQNWYRSDLTPIEVAVQ